MRTHTATLVQLLYHVYCRLFSEADTSPHWIVTHVNFTAIFPRTCGPSDYYQWTVSDGVIAKP